MIWFQIHSVLKMLKFVTLSIWISDMVQDGQNQLNKQMKVTTFFRNSDGWFNRRCQLYSVLCYIRWNCRGSIHENIFFWKPQPNNKAGESLFKLLVEATEPFDKEEIRFSLFVVMKQRPLLEKGGFIVRLKSARSTAFYIGKHWQLRKCQTNDEVKLSR